VNPSEQNRKKKLDVWKGIGLALLLHLLLFLHPPGVVLIGLVQLIYIIPAIIIANVKGRKGIVQGLLIGAGITFLVNAACFGIVLSMFASY